MTGSMTDFDSLYKVRKGVVDIVTVPEFGYLMIDGHGAPGGPEFADAVQALYTVSYGAHFLMRRKRGAAPRILPLEALWWVDDPAGRDLFTAVALGQASVADTDRDRWCWRALIMQPEPIDDDIVTEAIEQARAKSVPALERLRYQRWAEGRCAQVLHIGPYAAEGPSIARLHEGILAAGYRACGRHHEIYLGDPRRSAPEKLRTILRHPVETA